MERRAEVNQDIATEEQIEPGEGRVHDEIVLREQHHFADARVDQIAATLLVEKVGQALRRDIRGYRRGLASSPGERNRISAEIRAKDLQRVFARSVQPLLGLNEDHRK